MTTIRRCIFRPELFPRRHEAAGFLRAVERGFEREIIKRLEYWDKLAREEKRAGGVIFIFVIPAQAGTQWSRMGAYKLKLSSEFRIIM